MRIDRSYKYFFRAYPETNLNGFFGYALSLIISLFQLPLYTAKSTNTIRS